VSNKTLEKMLRGMLELYILRLMAENPTHGYEIIATIKRDFGVYFGPSTVYPLLQKIEENEYAVSKWNMTGDRPRKIYTLTPKGKAVLKEGQIDLKIAVQPMLLTQ